MRSLTFYKDYNPLLWFDINSFINISLVIAASVLLPSFICFVICVVQSCNSGINIGHVNL